ncbi:MAG TPA: 5-(carboxyamino)imidazole ribonucleotide synthase [Candidatus Limnocylindrales bacterium]|nr:5-(carboxyamino)imidazole ribonucleotide synthase [Candidatus Limnocylindrales bacterium]
MSDLPIRPYERRPASFHPWDPATGDVAREVARLVASACSIAVVEHVGSSSVPGLPGKNFVDLGIEADPDDIPAVSQALLSLGFGRQEGIAPFPPTRPMFTGSVVHEGRSYPIHLHVMPRARGELAELVAFRDALRADPALRDAYAEAKRRIVEDAPDGSANQLYTARKGGFVLDALYLLGIRTPPVDRPEPLPPGSTIGIMGGGQLGRMLALSARTMGYRIVALDPDPACPTASVADELIVGRYDDADAARRLGALSDVVTYELEHVGIEAAAAAGEGAPLRPGLAALRATQDRLAERRFIREIGEYTSPWREVRGVAEAEAAADALGYPCRLKLPLGGYDGRSQVRVASRAAVAAAVASLGGADGRPLLLEAEIDFEGELSCIIARDRDGRTLAFPPAANVHDDGILVESLAPAPVHPLQAYDASEIAERLARSLDLVGLLTVELFRLRGGGLMINELAPRVHNSGHWTLEGAATSQFEQHLRAILGLPLGSVAPHGTAAMVNLLGTGPDRDARLAGLPDALHDPAAHVHVYGKRRVFERRKMGHVTVIGSDADDALARARAARAALRWEE